VAQVAADMLNRALRLIEALLPSRLGAWVVFVPEQADPLPAATRGAVPMRVRVRIAIAIVVVALLRGHKLEEARVDTPPTDAEPAGQLVVRPADFRLELVRLEPDRLQDALEHRAALRGQRVLGVVERGVDHRVVDLELALLRLVRLRDPALRLCLRQRGGRRSCRRIGDWVPDLRDG